MLISTAYHIVQLVVTIMGISLDSQLHLLLRAILEREIEPERYSTDWKNDILILVEKKCN